MTFQINDVVKCIKPCEMANGVKINKSDNITITLATLPYFQFHKDNFVLWHRGT